jgi:tyrosyl-tRNA synthetase
MNPMVPGLAGGKMSSSDPNSKIDFLDGPSVVSSKIAAAHCVKGAPKDNGILAFVRRVILPIGELKRSQGRAAERTWAATDECVFSVGEKNFGTANELDEAWEAGSINEGDLKDAVAAAINALLEPIQRDLEHDDEFKQAELAAYPEVIGEEEIKVEKEEVVPSLLPPSNLCV